MPMKIEELALSKIEFRGITFQSDEGDRPYANVDFSFPLGKIVWIRGQGGTGRSVILKIMAGLLAPHEGKYFLNDYDIFNLSFEEFTPIRLAIGYSFDYGGLISNQTVYQNLILPFLYHKLIPPEEAHQRVENIIRLFGLEKVKNQRPAMISGGMKKATCIIRAMVLRPQLLLLDDPTQGLSPDRIETLVSLINMGREAGYFTNIFITSNDESFMQRLSHEQIEIKEQKLFHGPTLRKVAQGENQI